MLATAAAFLTGTPIMVSAQDDTAAQPGGETVVLDTIRVTTRRTEEALEAVPGSVVVLDDQEIERADIRNSIDVIRRLPNVSFTEGSDPTDVDLSIRVSAALSARPPLPGRPTACSSTVSSSIRRVR